MSETQKSRMQSFKNNSKNSAEMRERRLETTVELRKSKKEDQLSKRRNIEDDDNDITSPLKENNGQMLSPIALSLDEILKGMASSNVMENFKATRAARKMLSRERNPPIDALIGHGIVPVCVQFLDIDD